MPWERHPAAGLLLGLVLVVVAVPAAAMHNVPPNGAGEETLSFVFTDNVHDEREGAVEMWAEEHDPPEEPMDIAGECHLWVAQEDTAVRFEIPPQTVMAQLHFAEEGNPAWERLTIQVGKATLESFDPAGKATITEPPSGGPGTKRYPVNLTEHQTLYPADEKEDEQTGDFPAVETCVDTDGISRPEAVIMVGINSGIEYEDEGPSPMYPTPDLSTSLLSAFGLTTIGLAGLAANRRD